MFTNHWLSYYKKDESVADERGEFVTGDSALKWWARSSASIYNSGGKYP